jgi:hypothetical protein
MRLNTEAEAMDSSEGGVVWASAGGRHGLIGVEQHQVNRWQEVGSRA